VTTSIGLVAFPLHIGTHAHSWADAVTVADWGLYRAKQSGRACAVVVEVQATAGGVEVCAETVWVGCSSLPVVPHVVRREDVVPAAVVHA
jgi:hypothetical protein